MMAKLNGLFRALAPADAPRAPDAELLARFVADRCEAAFAELVRRYGPMVLAACRRVCGDAHLAEDAFQAAFVVFAAKANTVNAAAALPAWLHSVATRTALRARTVAHRRSRRETPVEVLPERATREPSAADGADLARAVDEEIAKLPEALRAAVVLCELQGESRRDAAAQLGVPEGTVSSRLAAARKALAERLTNRGLAPSAAALSVALASGATASVPTALAARALAALTPDTLPAAVAALSSGVLRAMLAQKLKCAVPFLALALGALVWGALALAVDPPAPPVAPVPRPAGTAKALPKGPNKLVYYHNDHIVMANPDGTGATPVVDLSKHHLPAGRLSFAPDGSAVIVQPTLCASMAAPVDTHLVRLNPELGAVTVQEMRKVRKLDKTIYQFSRLERAVCWSADGTKVLETGAAEDENGKRTRKEYGHQITDLATGKGAKVDLPGDQRVLDWGPDGAFLALQLTPKEDERGAWDPQFRLWILDAKGKPDTEIESPDGDFYPSDPKFSRDGRKVLFSLMRKAHDKVDNRHFKSDEGLVVYDRDTKKVARVELPTGARVMSSCWSPDGTKIAYSWHTTGKRAEDDAKHYDEKLDWYLTVADASGANAKHIVKAKGSRAEYSIGEVAWR